MHGCSNLVAGWQCIQHDARVRLERGCSVIPGRFTTLAAMFFGVLTIFTSSFIVSDVEHSVHNQKLSRRYRPVNDVILVIQRGTGSREMTYRYNAVCTVRYRM